MAKKENKKLIIWAVVALVIGVILGLFITTAVTTGKAKSAVSEAQFRNAEISLFGELRLDQWFDNIGNNYYTNYYFYQYEYAETNVPATLEKDSQISSNSYTFGNYSPSTQLKLNDYGKYSTNGFSYVSIPFVQNNLTLNSSFNGRFIFEDGREVFKHKEFVANLNGDAFAEVMSFDFDCSGQYQMEHADAGSISNVQFYLNIYNLNTSNNWHYEWDQTPPRNYYYMGYFPPEATAILSDGSEYQVYLTANIHTNAGNFTSANTGKEINCQTGKQNSLSSEQLEQIKEKTGNTPKQIAEKLAKK